jgi:hypothetical protein
MRERLSRCWAFRQCWGFRWLFGCLAEQKTKAGSFDMAATKKQKPQPKPVDALAIFDHAYRIISAEQEMPRTSL